MTTRSPRVSDQRPIQPEPHERVAAGLDRHAEIARTRRHPQARRSPACAPQSKRSPAPRSCRDARGRARRASARARRPADARGDPRGASTASMSGVASVPPRATSLSSTPPRLTATRRGAVALPACCAVHVQAAHADAAGRPAAPRANRRPRSRPETSVPVTTAPKPLHRERAVDRQADDRRARAARDVAVASAASAAASSVEPLAASAPRPATMGAPARKAAGDQLAHLERDELQRLGVGEVGLRQRDEPALDAEQPADVEVLARLRLHALVGGHDEQHGVDAARAGQHRCGRTARDRARRRRRARCRRPGTMREPELDRDAARLLFLQPVGIGAGQRFNERALAVIDVARGADDDGKHVFRQGTGRRHHGSAATRGLGSNDCRPGGCWLCAVAAFCLLPSGFVCLLPVAACRSVLRLLPCAVCR